MTMQRADVESARTAGRPACQCARRAALLRGEQSSSKSRSLAAAPRRRRAFWWSTTGRAPASSSRATSLPCRLSRPHDSARKPRLVSEAKQNMATMSARTAACGSHVETSNSEPRNTSGFESALVSNRLMRTRRLRTVDSRRGNSTRRWREKSDRVRRSRRNGPGSPAG